MKHKSKIFILLPDGVGLRIFAYSEFYKTAKINDLDLVYWNNTPFNLTNLGFDEIKIQNSRNHFFTEIFKNTRKHIELNLSIKRENDNVYDSYRFPFPFKSLKAIIKSLITKFLIVTHSSEKGLFKIKQKINDLERKTDFYKQSFATLQKEKPNLVFCTNQRSSSAIAPILAAQDLSIPTASFIFSWDNLPKATMVTETDFYFVWSDLMKKELLNYYPYVKENQIFVTGTPQFDNHFDKDILLSKTVFFNQYNLDLNKDYICFSGDDETTSPDDEKYLDDFANAIVNLNKKGHKLGIIFRKCPVDFSGRYEKIIEKYKTVIVEIAPKWDAIGTDWNTILPTKEDNFLLSNTIEHSLFVVNIGSSMVFDFVSFNKPCCYFNYNQETKKIKNWDIYKCYKYVHFRSMPNKDAVVWFNAATEIENNIESLLLESESTVVNAKKWFETINQHPPEKASERICNAIKTILK